MNLEKVTLGAGTVRKGDNPHARRRSCYVRLARLEVEAHELEAIDLREATVLQKCERRLVVGPGRRGANGFPERVKMARQLAVERFADSFASVLRHHAERQPPDIEAATVGLLLSAADADDVVTLVREDDTDRLLTAAVLLDPAGRRRRARIDCVPELDIRRHLVVSQRTGLGARHCREPMIVNTRPPSKGRSLKPSTICSSSSPAFT